jgi:thioesterase domain-containing protein/acyl carrier protein
MEVTPASARTYVAPQNETERHLVEIWAQVLNLPPDTIGVNDDFFELGGHSLSAMQLMAKTNRYFKQMLPLTVLFVAPTIAAFSKLISSEEAHSFDIVVPIQTKGDATPVFAVPGVGGNVLSLGSLSKKMGDRRPFFGLQAAGLDGKAQPFSSVEQTARANVKAIKTVQPRGPYRLLGHSYGGVVAYEMVRVLLEEGEEISSLVLLDSIAPSIVQRNPVHDEASDLAGACTVVANLHGATLELDIDRLRKMSSEERVQYLVDVMKECGFEIDRQQFAAFYRVYRANLLCYRTYMPSPLPRRIDVSLYRATQGRPEVVNVPPDYGWDDLLQSPIRAFDVEANHFSILERCSPA